MEVRDDNWRNIFLHKKCVVTVIGFRTHEIRWNFNLPSSLQMTSPRWRHSSELSRRNTSQLTRSGFLYSSHIFPLGHPNRRSECSIFWFQLCLLQRHKDSRFGIHHMSNIFIFNEYFEARKNGIKDFSSLPQTFILDYESMSRTLHFSRQLVFSNWRILFDVGKTWTTRWCHPSVGRTSRQSEWSILPHDHVSCLLRSADTVAAFLMRVQSGDVTFSSSIDNAFGTLSLFRKFVLSPCLMSLL